MCPDGSPTAPGSSTVPTRSSTMRHSSDGWLLPLLEIELESSDPSARERRQQVTESGRLNGYVSVAAFIKTSGRGALPRRVAP